MNDFFVKSRLFSLLKALSKREKEGFAQFLATPYFNRRKDVQLLYGCILLHLNANTASTLSKEDLWHSFQPDDSFDDQNFRLTISYLSRLCEQFLAIAYLKDNSRDIKKSASVYLDAKNQPELAELLKKEAGKLSDKQLGRDVAYWQDKYDRSADQLRKVPKDSPEGQELFEEVVKQFDVAFLAAYLRQRTWLVNERHFIDNTGNASLFDQYVEHLSESQLPDVPAVRLYYYALQFLQGKTPEIAFKKFKDRLLTSSHHFYKTEALELHVLAINYAIRQITAEDHSYAHDILDLYKQALAKEYILNEGVLSSITYYNIISVALQIDEIEWASEFVENWTDKLERRYRERMYRFSQAKIAYTARDYDKALPILEQSNNYHYTLLNLGARTLLLKIYYELDRIDELMNHLDAFQNYLRRKTNLNITYHRTRYRNLIKFTKQLLKLPPGRSKQREQVQQAIGESKILAEKAWLVQQAQRLQ